MSDAQIKAVTDAITAFEADATPDLTKAKAIGTAYTAPAEVILQKLHQTLLKQLNQLMPH